MAGKDAMSFRARVKLLFLIIWVLLIVAPIDRAEAATDKAPKLLELARQKFNDPKDPLTKAEVKLFQAAESGEVAYCNATALEEIDPAKAKEWGQDRVLNADRVVWLCTNPQALKLVTHKGIQVFGARIKGTLDLEFAKIPFPLLFVKSAFLEGIVLLHAEIRGLCLPGTHTGPIIADGVNVKGYVFLCDGFQAEGGVRLPGATISGDLACNGTLLNEEAYALNADGLNVNHVFLRDGFHAEGGVSLLNAEINGNLDCTKAIFINNKNKETYALNADRLNVKGSVFLSDGFQAEGEVRLLGATINGNLECGGGRFLNEKGKALSADGLNVKGGVFLRKDFQVEGEVCFVDATIGGYFSCTSFVWPEGAALDLRSARIGTLYDDPKSWPQSGGLFLNGLVYDEIADLAPIDATSRIDWLHRQPEDHFRPHPYEQLASVLRKAGHDEDAKRILIQKNEDWLKYAEMGRLERFRHWLLGWTIGYGYRPWRPFWGILGFIALGWLFFGIGFQAGLITPTKQEAYSEQGEGREVLQDYPGFSALAFSVDTFVPLINLHQADYWLPNMKSGWLYCYMCVHIIAGWILTTLFIVGLTGLIRA